MNAGFVKRFNHESAAKCVRFDHPLSNGKQWRPMEERKDRMPPRNQLVACVIRQYGAGMYRAWVSLDKGHMVCLGAYQDEADATETIDRFLDTYRGGRIKTPEDILPHIDILSNSHRAHSEAEDAMIIAL
jgi:hypothetical protein